VRYLTKSRFSRALECPRKLTYLDNRAYANANDANEFLKALAEGGHQVGALAKCLFPDGIEVDAMGHDAQVEQTKQLLEQDEVVLFEAAFRVGKLFIRVDLLRKSGNVIDLFEVKAKGFDPADPGFIGASGGFLSGMKPYLYDVAFQRHVLRQAFPEHRVNSHLVMPDTSRTCKEAGLAQRLRIVKAGERVRIEVDPSLRDGAMAREILAIVPVDSLLDRLVAEPMQMGGYTVAFDEGIEMLARQLDAEGWAPRLGAHCKSCEFHSNMAGLANGMRDGRLECLASRDTVRAHMAKAGKETVFDLYNFRRIDALVDEGKLLLLDLEQEDVKFKPVEGEISASHRQWLQVEESNHALDGAFLCEQSLDQAFASLAYPLHFIDFETSRPALPFHPGRRPYEQLLFQFSHHQLEADGRLAHLHQHLADADAGWPNIESIRALKHAVGGDDGKVLHWWDHERTVLREVRGQIAASHAEELDDREELLVFIDSLIGPDGKTGRLFDLGRLVHRTTFLPGTRGSSSLKKVLPAMLASVDLLRDRYARPDYGNDDWIPSLNFKDQAWIRYDDQGSVIDPYKLLGERTEDPDLQGLEGQEEKDSAVADGGAAMVAYGLLQNHMLGEAERDRLRLQLLRYCELDTLAMVMAWQGLLQYRQQRAFPHRRNTTNMDISQ
jgi:hypothetical protein